MFGSVLLRLQHGCSTLLRRRVANTQILLSRGGGTLTHTERMFTPQRYVSSRPTLYQYVAKVSRDLASEAKSFPAAYHPILIRLQYAFGLG